MCGIAGFLSNGGLRRGSVAALTGMTDRIAHRGPDSSGHWLDEEAGVALGHRRLAIVELSEAGHQPMMSPSGRLVLAYNGEIYNHVALRRALEDAGVAPNWRGGSDTETLLAAIDAWGLDRALRESVGMFAIALWDRTTRRLDLVRDRMGEKPLYYGWQGRSFLFGSELKALTAHPAFAGEIARPALAEVLRHGHVGEDRSIYRGIAKVRPGEIVTLHHGRAQVERRRYWDGAAIAAARRPAPPTEAETTDHLESLLRDAVRDQMAADVPLGAFLSGGIDSSLIVALMARLSDRPVHSFSIGFNEARYDEAGHARAVAAHLGTDHTELYVSDRDLMDVVPRLPDIYDEPFADSSQIPTFLVAQMARRDVTVALSGDGADELFGGYGRYGHALRLRAQLARMPDRLRQMAVGGVQALPAGALTRLLGPILRTPQGKQPIGQRLHRLADYARAGDLESLHRAMVSVWRDPLQAVRGVAEPDGLLTTLPPPRGDLGDVERMMQLDLLTYMVDDILAKVDRATMAVSLESRAPLLDHRVVEYALSLPQDLKWRPDETKVLLRRVLYRHVPRALIERPKMGFEVPIGLWLRGGLRDWAESLLDPRRLREDGYFDADVIVRMWREHLSGRFNWGAQLWCVLMVQAWLDRRG